MPAGTNILMVTPDNEEVEVSPDHFEAALAKKLEPAMEYVDKNGSVNVVRKQHFKQAEKAGLKPKAIYDAEQTPLPKHALGKVSVPEAALRGATQGASMNFADEAVAGLASLLPGRNYKDELEYTRARDKAAQEQNPKSYLAADVLGSLVSPNPVKGGGLIKTVAGSAAQGAASALSASEDKKLDDLTSGAGYGAAGGLAAKGLQKGLGAGAKLFSSENLKGIAERQATKATGAMRKDAQRIMEFGGPEKFGRELLDTGLVKAGDTAESIGEKALTKAQTSGEEIGSRLQSYGQQGVKVPMQLFKKNVLENVTAKLKQPGTPTDLKRVAYEIESEVNNITQDFQKRGGWVTPEEANGIKSKLYDLVYRNQKTPSLSDNEKRKMAQELMNVVDDSIGGKLGEAEKEAFKGAKRAYGASTIAAGIGEDAAERAIANRAIAPSTYLAGAAGAAAGGGKGPLEGGLLGIATGLANQLGLKYGNAAAAAGFDKLANVLATTPGKIPSQTLKILEEAAKKGNSSLAATHLMLMQRDPTYKQALESP